MRRPARAKHHNRSIPTVERRQLRLVAPGLAGEEVTSADRLETTRLVLGSARLLVALGSLAMTQTAPLHGGGL